MREKEVSTKKRPTFQSVFFMINECIDAISVLEETNHVYKRMMEMGQKERDDFIFDQKTIISMLGVARDCFCIRLAYLFDKRKDVHSLKKHFAGNSIDELERHPMTIASIKARHNNIAHMSREFVKWPNVDEILSSDLKKSLEKIRDGILFTSRGTDLTQ